MAMPVLPTATPTVHGKPETGIVWSQRRIAGRLLDR